MFYPNFKKERELKKQNNEIITIGIDEAGRGPLAGPVVAAATFFSSDFYENIFDEQDLIRDSKTLSEKQRKEMFRLFSNNEHCFFSVAEVSEKIIDRVNIRQATLLAMRFAVEELLEKISQELSFQEENVLLLVDGNTAIPKLKYQQLNFIKGDQAISSIAAASICAKVTRDRMMESYHQKFSQYGFDKHKGYGTKQHLDNLAKFGPCSLHRKTFAPVKKLVSKV
ncbi:MAG TPA: ribonuclease HII [Candidatus Moranbacteria bacterium]|nr:ribonuclease HII [Candidatus Moranbacteria bacterium]